MAVRKAGNSLHFLNADCQHTVVQMSRKADRHFRSFSPLLSPLEMQPALLACHAAAWRKITDEFSSCFASCLIFAFSALLCASRYDHQPT